MSHYVYVSTGEKVPPTIGVFTLPAGVNDEYPNGASFTKELPTPQQVTAVYDSEDFPPAQREYQQCEAGPKMQEQLDKIEEQTKPPAGGGGGGGGIGGPGGPDKPGRGR